MYLQCKNVYRFCSFEVQFSWGEWPREIGSLHAQTASTQVDGGEDVHVNEGSSWQVEIPDRDG